LNQPLRFDRQDRQVPVGTRYTRMVGALKLLLPLLALALIATVILWASSYDREQGFELSFITSQDASSDRLTMVNPRYVGTDVSNQPFTVTAELAEQDPKDQRQVTLTGVQADMTTDGGTWFTAMAPAGHYRQETNILKLDGPISVFSDAGYEFHAETAEIDLGRGTATSPRPVRGQGPFGTLRADRMDVKKRGQLLQFSGNVRLVIEPGQKGGE
jgi:lipopolysaccharide export system protein LptC